MRSFREGLCSETSSRSRHKPKENAQRPSCTVRTVFFYGGFLMDGLLTCAKAFENLLPVKYHIIIGRKGKSVDLTVSFQAVEFHHLMGLHKLHDLRLSRANREKVFSQILSGQITLDDVKKSRYFCSIQKRLDPFQKIEELFDKNDLIFRYNRKLQAFSLIRLNIYFLHHMSIPMCISSSTKKTRQVIFSAVPFFQKRRRITQKTRQYTPF